MSSACVLHFSSLPFPSLELQPYNGRNPTLSWTVPLAPVAVALRTITNVVITLEKANIIVHPEKTSWWLSDTPLSMATVTKMLSGTRKDAPSCSVGYKMR